MAIIGFFICFHNVELNWINGYGLTLVITVHLPLHVALLHVLPLVIKLLAAAKPQKHLGIASLVEVNLKRDDRVAPLADLAAHAPDFPLVEEQFPLSQGVVAAVAALGVFRDMQVK